jgi:hypothetical protein
MENKINYERFTHEEYDSVYAIFKNDIKDIANLDSKYLNNKPLAENFIRTNPLSIQYFSETIRDNDDVVLKGLDRESKVIEFASERLKSDPQFMLKAIGHSPLAFKYASMNLKADREFSLEAIKLKPNCYQYLDDKFKNSNEFIVATLLGNGLNLRHMPDAIRSNREMAHIAVKVHGSSLKYLSEELRDDFDMVSLAIERNGTNIAHASERLKNNKELALKAVSNDGFAIQHLSETLKSDLEVANLAIKENFNSIKYISERLKNNFDFMFKKLVYSNENMEIVTEQILSYNYENEDLTAKEFFYTHLGENIKNNSNSMICFTNYDPVAIGYIGEELKGNKDLAMQVLALNGNYLPYFNDSVRSDDFVARIALINAPEALQYVTERTSSNKNIIQAVMCQNNPRAYWALKYASPELKQDKELVRFALARDIRAFEFADEIIRKDKDFILDAINQNPNVFEFLDDDMKKDMDILKIAIKKNPKHFIFVTEDVKNDVQALYELILVLKEYEKNNNPMWNILHQNIGKELKDKIGSNHIVNYIETACFKLELENDLMKTTDRKDKPKLKV